MEQLYVFGTGNAAVTRCYNTCFAIRDEGQYLMVDAGGGNGILRVLEDMDVDLGQMHHLFVSHKHNDHTLGVVWVVRMVATRMKKGTYDGDLSIYCFEDLIPVIRSLCQMTLQEKFARMLDGRIRFVPVADGETVRILGHDMTFFDIQSTKDRQFGFTTTLKDGQRLTFLGDEPYNAAACADYVKDCGWLLHEAFCLYSQRDRFQPYEKHHSTVKDACQLAQELGARHLVLWHTEDKNISRRRELYLEEGRRFYRGDLHIPEDGEILPLT